MKKTFTININGIVFHIDEDAYEILQAYLGKISSRFSNTEEGKEIIDDIEGRIAELFSERLKDNKEVITINDVEEIIEIMGQPEDIINEEEVSSEGKSSPRYWRSRTGKRVYRDTDERILGGVCSGIAAYFGLYPIILRIIFVILCFIPAGSGLLIYIILWIIIPEAKTTAQKLEMKGEKVNVGNIEKSIKDEFEGVKKNWEKIKKEKKYRGVGHAIERIFYFIGDMIKVILNALGPVLGFVLVIIGLLILLGVFGSLIFTYGAISISNHSLSMFAAPEIFNIITDSTFALITYIGIILLIGIPIVGIIYSGVRLLFRVKSRNKIFNAAAGSLWFIGLFMLILTGIGIGKDFRLETENKENYLIKYQNSDTLFISANEDTLIRGGSGFNTLSVFLKIF